MRALLTFICTGFLTACSNSSDVSLSVIKTNLISRMDKVPFCIHINNTSNYHSNDNHKFLVIDELNEDTSYRMSNAQILELNAGRLAPHMALVDAGLLSVTDTTIDSGNSQIKAKGYDLTEKAKPFMRHTESGQISPNEICYGKGKLIEVKNYTIPSDATSIKILSVSFTYKVQDVAAWAKLESIQKYYSEIKPELAPIVEGKAEMVLTNKGWINIEDAKL